MKYKVGDKVRIKSLDWYNANKDEDGEINIEEYFDGFSPGMVKYCGATALIMNIKHDTDGDYYTLSIDGGYWRWFDFMFDENFEDMKTKEITIPDGWEVDKIEDNKVILKKSKKELPKTWEECYTALKDGEYITNDCDICYYNTCSNVDKDKRRIVPIGLGKPLLALCQLLVCRDVYRQGWKPDWDKCDYKYCIKPCVDNIVTEKSISIPRVLSFQSREIRDQFIENFKDLIDEAKELI